MEECHSRRDVFTPHMKLFCSCIFIKQVPACTTVHERTHCHVSVRKSEVAGGWD